MLAAAVYLAVEALNPAQPAEAIENCDAVGMEMDSVETQMLASVRGFSSVADSAPLETSLQRAAAWMARDMAENGAYGGHTDSLGRFIFQRIYECGYGPPQADGQAKGVGEAISGYVSGHTDPQEVLDWWHEYTGDPLCNAGSCGGPWNALGIARYQTSGGKWHWVVTVGKVVYEEYAGPAPTPTPTATPTAPINPTATWTPSPTSTATTTPTAAATATPTSTATPPPSSTPTATPTEAVPASPTPSPTQPVGGLVIEQGWQSRTDLPTGPLPQVLSQLDGCRVEAIYRQSSHWQRYVAGAPSYLQNLNSVANGVEYWVLGAC